MTAPDLPKLYTLAEVCAAMQCSYTTVYRLLTERCKGIVRPVGRGRGLRLTYSDYVTILEALRRPCPTSSTPPAPAKATAIGSREAPSPASGLKSPRAKLTKTRLRKKRLASLRQPLNVIPLRPEPR